MIKATINMGYKILYTIDGFQDYYICDLAVYTDEKVIHKNFTCIPISLSNLVSEYIKKQLLEVIEKGSENNA